MYLLYVDDSGLVTDKNCQHCVLAGFAIRETQTYWVQQAIDDIVLKHTGRVDLELHGTHIKTGKNEWRNILPKQRREDLIYDILNYIASNYPQQFILFGVVLNKQSNQNISISEELFTQITSRFDKFLKRRYAKTEQAARGIAIFDKSISELHFQSLSQTFQKTGNRWGDTLANFVEVPLFLDSKMSRLIQLADIIAYSLFRKYEHSDEGYFSIIQNCFDKDTGIVHGLYER